MAFNFFKPTLFLIFFGLFTSCVSVEDDEESNDNPTKEISSSSISGFLNSEAYTPLTIHFEKGTSFGKNGYEFKLFDEIKECDEFQSIGNISFFIESEVELTTGNYEANGPYFNYKDGEDFGTVSFFGAEVIIENVSNSEISARVRGGDDNNIHYIEGYFVAELCQK